LNKAAADQSNAKDNIPPALFSIVQNCLDGKYESIATVYDDFKSLLIYSVFIGGGSVDNLIRKNYHKAKVKRRLTPLRRLAAIIIVLLLAAGVWTLVKDLDIAAFNKNKNTVQNTKPTAQYTASKEQVIVGETVIFISHSSDQDANDSIKSYLWVISKNDTPVFNSTNQNIAYMFSEVGKYGVHLVVSDSREETSEPYKTYINVLPTPVIPSSGADSGSENNK
jgi:hypothetical protein